jgi:hypothetical protein
MVDKKYRIKYLDICKLSRKENMSKPFPIIIILSLFIFACDPFGSDDRVDSQFEANISGEITAQIQGRSTFGTFVDPLTGMTATILIMIPSGNAERGINISGLTVSTIELSSYPIIESTLGGPFDMVGTNEFSASYNHDDDQYSELFQSKIGRVTFTNRTETLLEGSFLFDAIGYRIVSNEKNGASDSTEVLISIEGTFTSIRGELL